MVTTVDKSQNSISESQRGGLVVEIIGIAGTGKSTLYRAFNNSVPWVLNESIPPVWNFSFAPFYIKNIGSLVPTLIHLRARNERFPDRREIAFMAILNGWHAVLRKKSKTSDKVILTEQGAIAKIADLYLDGPSCLKSSSTNLWWEGVYKNWAEILNVIVLLDSSFETLIWRIRNREQDHRLKGMRDQEAITWLEDYRKVYEHIVSRLTANNPNIRVIQIDSGNYSVDEIKDQLLLEFNIRIKNTNQ
jgi:thymidylate kinase